MNSMARIKDQLDNKLTFLADIPGENYEDQFVFYRDENSHTMSRDTMIEQYLEETSAGTYQSDLSVEINYSTGDPKLDVMNSKTMGLSDGSHGFPESWVVDRENNKVFIPLEDFLNDNYDGEIYMLKMNMDDIYNTGEIAPPQWI